ncbi:MAG: TonB-dependent receptor [Acidobacteria bacterium]|nr:TonB-dependent receptor [Acidobacteriota bacterium]
MSRNRLALYLLATNCLFTGLADAQVLYGTLVGSVSDPQQASIAGAAVTARNPATGYQAEANTDDRGAYEFRNLTPGVYEIKITKSGFTAFEAKDISIAANNVVRVDAALKVGNITEVVTVGAEVALLQADKSDIHYDVGSKQLSEVAIGGYRNFQSVMDFMPGTTPAAFQNASTDSPARALTTNVNGTARNSNNLRIDGAANVFTWLPHHSMYVPALESVEALNVSTNNFDAEQGMAGGAALSVVTKSGTNSFHGVAFWYHSNHKWGAKNLFFNPNTPAGSGIPQRIDNQAGGTFGGPIKKDRLFFFTSWERTTTAERGNGLLSVATAQVRSGNFANLAGVATQPVIHDPASAPQSGVGRTPFPNNVVPESRWAPAARTLQSMIPLPNTGAGQLNNFFASVPYYFKRDQVDGKVNYTPNSKTNIFGKFSTMLAPVFGGAPLGEALGGYPGGAAGAAGIGTGENDTWLFGGGISYTITPTLLFDANIGGTRMNHTTAGPDFGKNIGLDVLRIPGTNGTDPRQSGFPIFNINGYTGLGNTNNWSPVLRNDRVYTYAANASWTRGAHALRFGIDMIQHQMNHWQPELGSYSPRGGFNFNPGVTGAPGVAANNYNAYAAFLLGLPQVMGKSYQFYDPMRTREFQQGYFIRDNWQVNRKLNLTLGLRMEHYPIMNRGEFGIERYDITTNKVIIGGRGNNPRDAGTTAAAIMWAPRIGLAYRATDKTVIRAGYGITNDPYPVSRPVRSPYPAVIVDEYVGSGFSWLNNDLRTGIPSVRFPDLSSGIIDIPNTVSTNSLQPGRFRRGYIQSTNFTFQRELAGGIVIQSSYVGTRSIRQALTYFNANAGLVAGAGNAGRPLSSIGVNVDRNFFIPMAHQRYDGWQTNISRRVAGAFVTLNYTLSKTRGINSGNSDNGLRFYVPSQFTKNNSVADFDRRHSINGAANLALPFGKGKKWATGGMGSYVLGGWQINPTFQLHSGLPFIVTADGTSLAAPGNTQVADLTGTATKRGGVGLGNPFYETSAFAPVTQARFGNMSLNQLRGPRLFVSNLGIFRSFTLSERVNLQFRGEALNWTNTPSLANPNANVSAPANFMAITAANVGLSAQRTMRFGLRLAF